MGFKLVLNTVHLLRAEPCLSALLSLCEILRMSKWMMCAVRTPNVSRGNKKFSWGPTVLSYGTDRCQVDLSPFTLKSGKTKTKIRRYTNPLFDCRLYCILIVCVFENVLIGKLNPNFSLLLLVWTIMLLPVSIYSIPWGAVRKVKGNHA